MKLLILAQLISAVVWAVALPKSEAVNFDGFKVYRIDTKGKPRHVQQQLAHLPYEQWNYDISRHIDISISPDKVAAFEALGLDYHCMHDDLGSSIAAEAVTKSSWKRQVNDLSWFDSYHPYDDHYQYFQDLQASFPDNSELVSTGTSYEGRDMFGIHLWGADGPGRPAVLWHGTVHAREWITAMVSPLLQP